MADHIQLVAPCQLARPGKIAPVPLAITQHHRITGQHQGPAACVGGPLQQIVLHPRIAHGVHLEPQVDTRHRRDKLFKRGIGRGTQAEGQPPCRCRPGQVNVGIAVQQAVIARRPNQHRHGQHPAEHGATSVGRMAGHHGPGMQAKGAERREIILERQFGLRTAAEVLPHEVRQAPPGYLGQFGDTVNAIQVAAGIKTTHRQSLKRGIKTAVKKSGRSAPDEGKTMLRFNRAGCAGRPGSRERLPGISELPGVGRDQAIFLIVHPRRPAIAIARLYVNPAPLET